MADTTAVMTIEAISATSWIGDFFDWASALADRVTALAKKYGAVAEGVLAALDAFRNDPSIANAYALWDAFVQFKDTAEVAHAASGPQVAMSFGDWQAAVALLLQLLDAIRQRRAG